MRFDIKETILQFYKEIIDDPHHRNRSWEHCYAYFQKHLFTKDEGDIDIATLHLAFYLASWGMYRGSTTVLQKDYQVHSAVVRELLDEQYAPLWILDFDRVYPDSSEIDMVFQLNSKIRQRYLEVQGNFTDTLTSKVLLGTICCMPAYDTLFYDGERYWNELPEEFLPKFPAKFGRNSYNGLIYFYQEHREKILAAQKEIEQYGVKYPVMKLIDMFFWNIGYQLRPR